MGTLNKLQASYVTKRLICVYYSSELDLTNVLTGIFKNKNKNEKKDRKRRRIKWKNMYKKGKRRIN